jgi:hypothetical protein
MLMPIPNRRDEAQYRSVKLIFCVLSFFPSVFAVAGEMVSFDELYANNEKFQRHYLTVRGIVAIDPVGHQYLFATRVEARQRNYPKSIDILPFRDTDPRVPALRDLACAELYGEFQSWSGYITTDYLLSGAGGLRVKRVSSCPPAAAS